MMMMMMMIMIGGQGNRPLLLKTKPRFHGRFSLQVRGYFYDLPAAGGHQLYGCLGTSHSQAPPFFVALYGLPHEQARFKPVSFTFAFNRLLTSATEAYWGHSIYEYIFQFLGKYA